MGPNDIGPIDLAKIVPLLLYKAPIVLNQSREQKKKKKRVGERRASTHYLQSIHGPICRTNIVHKII